MLLRGDLAVDPQIGQSPTTTVQVVDPSIDLFPILRDRSVSIACDADDDLPEEREVRRFGLNVGEQFLERVL